MMSEFDVIIVGSGPAGTSAAYPLVQAGLKVLMVDASTPIESPVAPKGSFLANRKHKEGQWKWMVGEDFHALNNLGAVSPKLRAPTHAHIFRKFSEVNHIESTNFSAVGSLAAGGLSNAWGCGVARIDKAEFADLNIDFGEMERSYEIVSRRIGISGQIADDLSSYFGLDQWLQPPLPIDKLHQQLIDKYNDAKNDFSSMGFRLGRSRVAVLSQDKDGRKACDLSGNCMWGCDNQSLYSAHQELEKLKLYPGFEYLPEFPVDDFFQHSGFWTISSKLVGKKISARKLILAAGTLASTRLVLKQLNYKLSLPMQSSPTAAFLIWLPRMLGTPRVATFGLGQLSFTLELASKVTTFGSTFSTTGLPVSEFVSRIPMSNRYGVEFLERLLSSCLVGNIFFPGHLSNNNVSLTDDGSLRIVGEEHPSVAPLMKKAEKLLRKAYWKLGAILLPMSFTVGRLGADIHYAGTLPMRNTPELGNTDTKGELVGLPGVYVVDGACLPVLTEKSHTLTVMANADRIARLLTSNITRL